MEEEINVELIIPSLINGVLCLNGLSYFFANLELGPHPFKITNRRAKKPIVEIKDALKTREDQLLRLQGAIEGLRLATKDDAPAPVEEPKAAKVK